MEKDMTKGSPMRLILGFAVPLLFGLRRFLPDFPPEFSVFSLKIIFFHYIIKKKE